MAWIEADSLAERFKFFRGLPAILKTMKVNFYTCLLQTFYAIVSIDHPSIVRRIWYIKCNNIQLFSHTLSLAPSALRLLKEHIHGKLDSKIFIFCQLYMLSFSQQILYYFIEFY